VKLEPVFGGGEDGAGVQFLKLFVPVKTVPVYSFLSYLHDWRQSEYTLAFTFTLTPKPH
jgi:hypothetical protein